MKMTSQSTTSGTADNAPQTREEAFPRREFLKTALLGATAVGAGAHTATEARAQEQPRLVERKATTPGLIIRERDPENLEFPFSSLNTFLTPNDKFFVRNHFGAPRVEAGGFRLQIEGAVERPFEMTFDELTKLPSKTITATLESAGNNRVFLSPRERGVPWELGAVGTAEWTGTPLSSVLERAGVRPEAVEVILESFEAGEVRDEPRSPGGGRYARSLPLSKAMHEDTLLVWKMNGADLPQSQGFPLRVVVPGWYAESSVKWLARIVVSSVPFRGYFQAMDYVVWERRNGMALLAPVTEMQVKAQIARPAPYEVVEANKPYRVFGAAWAGESDVAQVEISGDDGRTWQQAALLGSPVRYAWRFWEYRWQTPQRSGRYNLMARATDSGKRVQPMQREGDRRHHMISHVLPIAVEVR